MQNLGLVVCFREGAVHQQMFDMHSTNDALKHVHGSVGEMMCVCVCLHAYKSVCPHIYHVCFHRFSELTYKLEQCDSESGADNKHAHTRIANTHLYIHGHMHTNYKHICREVVYPFTQRYDMLESLLNNHKNHTQNVKK